MSAQDFRQPSNSGSLFKNGKQGTPGSPQAKGRAFICGRWFWVSAWTGELKDGSGKYQWLKFDLMPRTHALRAQQGSEWREREAAEAFNRGGNEQQSIDSRASEGADGGAGGVQGRRQERGEHL